MEQLVPRDAAEHELPTDLGTETFTEYPSVNESELHAADVQSLLEPLAKPESTISHAQNFIPDEEIQISTTIAGNLSPALPLPSSLFERAEIDTALPFESVKEAVTLFGERMEWKAPYQRTSSMEKHGAVEADLQKVDEDLAQVREQVVDTKQSTDCILAELNETRKLIQELAGSTKSQSTNEQVLTSRSDMQSAYLEVKAGLQAVRKEMDSVRVELHSVADAKQVAYKQLNDLNTMSSRIEELNAELAATNEALTAAHMAHVDVEEQTAALRAGMEVNIESIATETGDKVEIEGQNLNDLESNLEDASLTASKLKAEIYEVKESQRGASISTAEVENSLIKVKLDLEQAKAAESEAVIALGRVCAEIDEAKASLKALSDGILPLSSKIELLRLQPDKEREELKSAQASEGSACARLASLQAELVKVREELTSAISGEAKAKEMMLTLPTAIKLAASRADESKAAAEAFKEEYRKTRHEAEEARAATSTAECRLQAALKEAEAAKAAEAMAIAEFNAVTESEAKATVSISETDIDAGIIISLEEYSSLNQSALEAEELTRKQVTIAFQQVDEAKERQLEAQKSLETVSKEIELCRCMMEEAIKKADEAQSAKLAAEGELRRWRAEHEKQRKAGHISSTGTAGAMVVESPQSKIDSGKELSKSGLLPTIQERKMLQLDSFAQMLSLKVPAPENPGKVLPVEDLPKERTKRKTILARIASFVTRKRK